MQDNFKQWSRRPGARAIGNLSRAVALALAIKENPRAGSEELYERVRGARGAFYVALQALRELYCPACVRHGTGPDCEKHAGMRVHAQAARRPRGRPKTKDQTGTNALRASLGLPPTKLY